MKRILIRVIVSPFEYFTPMEAIRDDLLGDNSGNLLFQYSVLRTVMTEEARVDFITERDMKDAAFPPEKVNEEYDLVVLPFANAFRSTYARYLRRWVRWISKLKIPVIVAGIGLQDKLKPEMGESRPFDPVVKDFVKEILERSASIGVRGSITRDYLKSLGFPDSSIDVIGCPSMYTYGPVLPVKERRPLTCESRVGITGSIGNSRQLRAYLDKIRQTFPDYYYIPQLLQDLKLIYAGEPILRPDPEKPDEAPRPEPGFPSTLEHPDYRDGHARYFLNLATMLDFCRTLDFNIGSRFHGGVAPVLAGTPSLFIPTDSRVRELVEYHNLPMLSYGDMLNDPDIFDIYEKTDFTMVRKGHSDRVDHYLKFFEHNHVDTCDLSVRTPLDIKMEQVKLHPPVEPVNCVTAQEAAERLTQYRVWQNQENWRKYRKDEESLQWFRESSAFHIGMSRFYTKHFGKKPE